jgi:pyrimidine-nucleoside phosphorylase
MSQPLGDAVGNALDIAEAVEVLRGAHGRLRQLAVAFAARALVDTGLEAAEDAVARAERALEDGTALHRFGRMVEAQGGDPRVADDPWSVLPRAEVVVPLTALRSGVVVGIDAEAIGHASGALGAGRVQKGDAVDPAVGIVVRPKVGDRLEAGAEVGEVHARSDEAAAEAARRTLEALVVDEGPAEVPPLVYDWLDT